MPPGKRVAIVACMDARLNPYRLLGLQEGDAHLIRNAGGAITADAIRSLAISQRLLGTEAIMLIHHTDCGMLTFTDDGFRRQLKDDTGITPDWAPDSFDDPDDDVRQSIARINASPFIPRQRHHPRLRLRSRNRTPARSQLTRLGATATGVRRRTLSTMPNRVSLTPPRTQRRQAPPTQAPSIEPRHSLRRRL